MDNKYGIKIRNYEAGSICGVNRGIREYYDFTDAMLTNSLFLDFLYTKEEFKGQREYTRAVICIEFNYGTHSTKEEENRLKKTKKKIQCDETCDESVRQRKLAKVDEILKDIKEHPEKYVKTSAGQIRDDFYQNGVSIMYRDYKGEVTEIRYRMLYRTPGKAKKGSCMFIEEGLYEDAHNFLYMGLELPEKNAPIIEAGAYASLVTSTIVDRIQISPADILIVKDVKSDFVTNAISIETNADRECFAITRDNYVLSNEMFDGQALIDIQAFPEKADGYVLLRQHFTKCAAFAARIQEFFKDYFGSNYHTAVIKDMFGVEHKATDIKMITTNNAVKWLKFDITYKQWCRIVEQNGCLWGVVKTAHKSKLGSVQRMSYQMVNTLDIDTIGNVMKPSLDYVMQLKTDINVFINYLKLNSNFSNDYEALVALYEQDHEFEFSSYFRDRRTEIIRTYVLNMKSGKLIQNAENLTIVGSPYAMLLHAVGEDIEKDPTFENEPDAIQCYTKRFVDGAYLAEFRNPFNSRNNLGYLHNHYHEYMEKYFSFGTLIIAVNTRHTDFQDRNNGSDQDSDSIYVTDHPDIVAHAKRCYADYPTIVNNIPKAANHYDNTMHAYASVDNALAEAQLAIGESSNLAQICLTYTYNYSDKIFSDCVCILSVLAQAAIDNAKRKYDIDIPSEIARIKELMRINEHRYPLFWGMIRPGFNIGRINRKLKCPMNSLYYAKIGKHRSPRETIGMEKFFRPVVRDEAHPVSKSRKVEKLIEKYGIRLQEYQISGSNEKDEYLLLQDSFDALVEDIRKCSLPSKYTSLFSWLINRAFIITPNIQGQNVATKLNKRKAALIRVLYEVNPEALLKCFSKNIGLKQ